MCVINGGEAEPGKIRKVFMSSKKSNESIARLVARSSARPFVANCDGCKWTHKAHTQEEAEQMTRGHKRLVKAIGLLGHP